MNVKADHIVIGNGKLPQLATTDVSYLWRAAPTTPFPPTRDQKVGEVGWFNKQFPQIHEERKLIKASKISNIPGLQLFGKTKS